MEGFWYLALIFTAFGFWVGCGMAPAILVWLKNPNENTIWKIWGTLYCLGLGPIGFATIKEWLD